MEVSLDDGLTNGVNVEMNYADMLKRFESDDALDYDKNVALLNILKNAGQFDLLRKARLNFSKLYPLSVQLWKDWLSDEIASLSNQLQNQAANTNTFVVEDSFAKAFDDYYSAELWLKFCEFTLNHKLVSFDETAVAECRKCFATALHAMQYDAGHVSQVFAIYIQFERTVLDVYEADYQAAPDTVKANRVSGQRPIVASLLEKRLTIPAVDLETSNALADYFSFTNKTTLENDAELKLMYDDAVAFCRKISKYEERIVSVGAVISNDAGRNGTKAFNEKLFSAYRSYINFAINHNFEFDRIVLLFERAVSEFSLIPDLWSSYLDYLDEPPAATIDSKSGEKDIAAGLTAKRDRLHARACSNCPWSIPLWKRQIRFAEASSGINTGKLNSVLDRVLLYGSHWFRNPEHLVDVCLEVVACARRIYLKCFAPSVDEATTTADRQTLLAQQLVQIYEKCYAKLHSREGVDRYDRLPLAFAAIQAETFRNVAAFRGLFERVVERQARTSAVWLKYFMLERFLCAMNCSTLQIARHVLVRAVKEKRMDDKRMIADLLLQFERESNFSLAEHVESEQLCNEALQNDAAQYDGDRGGARAREPSDRYRSTRYENGGNRDLNYQNDDRGAPRRQDERRDVARDERHRREAVADERQRKAQKRRAASTSSHSSHNHIEIDDVEFSTAQQQRSSSPKPPVLPDDYENKAAQRTIEKSAKQRQNAAAPKEEQRAAKKPATEDAASKKTAAASREFARGEELNKLFIKGIQPECTRTELMSLFMPFGNVVDVRFPTKKNKTSQHRGVAYVEFDSSETAERARQATDGYELSGKPIHVFISDPQKATTITIPATGGVPTEEPMQTNEIVDSKPSEVGKNRKNASAASELRPALNSTAPNRGGMSRHHVSMVPANVQKLLARAARSSRQTNPDSSRNGDDVNMTAQQAAGAAPGKMTSNDEFRKKFLS